MNSLKRMAQEIFVGALAGCTVPNAFARMVSLERDVLRVGYSSFDLAAYGRIRVVAFGKAAQTMAVALQNVIPSPLRGIVVTPFDVDDKLPGLHYFVGGHPLPNQQSLTAGDSIAATLADLSSTDLVIFLVSGGGSALVERPLLPISFEDLVTTYEVLLGSGATIAEMNALRKHISALKGGRMAQLAAAATQLSLFVSDVPDSALDALASGPTMPDSTTISDCECIVARYSLSSKLPASVLQTLASEKSETPKSTEASFARCSWEVVLSPKSLESAAASLASERGFQVEVDNTCDDWEYAAAADHLLSDLRALRAKHPRVCLLSVGEVTVELNSSPGRGGRNQQFALYCAEKITGQGIAVLSAGSDGIDGNSPAAGAVVDGSTAEAIGSDRVRAALENFDAYPVLKSANCTIETGPTGNNLRDIRILLGA